MNLKKNWGSKIILSLRVGHNVLKQFLIIAIHFHNIFIHHTLTRTTRITYSEEKLQSCLKLRNFQNPFDTQNAEARFYPPNRCLGFDFKFKKFGIKQAIFIRYFSLTCKSVKKNIEVFFTVSFLCFTS